MRFFAKGAAVFSASFDLRNLNFRLAPNRNICNKKKNRLLIMNIIFQRYRR